jgi:type IV pilus assembly protein PilO
MNLAEINWDINFAGRWPWPVKAAIIAIISFLVAGLWFYFDTQAQLDVLEQAQKKETDLRGTFEKNQQKASSLDDYKRQLAEMEKIFGDMLRQLPDKTQVPELLVDVSQTGLASGLEFELFKPLNEAKKDFYAELPIDIRVIGNYVKFGTFVSGLAALPRIVTLHNIHIKRQISTNAGSGNNKKPSASDSTLVMEAQVKTYRYLDEASGTDTDKKPAKGKKPAPAAAAKKPAGGK